MSEITESDVEEIALNLYERLCYSNLYGPEIAPEEPSAERSSYNETILERRFKDCLIKLNPKIPSDALEEAFRKVTRPESPSTVINNHEFHKMLVNGIPVEYVGSDGRIVHDNARIVDFQDPDNNDWLVVNQFTVEEGEHNRRPDIVMFLNGLPMAVIELKNPTDEKATIWSAYNQLQTYKSQIPSLFNTNEMLIISDGLEARFGSLTANREWFLPWRTIEGEELAPTTMPQIEVMIKGLFQKDRFLQYIRHFVVYEEIAGGSYAKKIAGYHQFHAVLKAVEYTLSACGVLDIQSYPFKSGEDDLPLDYKQKDDDFDKDHFGKKRIGVVWHTQGSGKSLSMAFYTGKMILEHAMENPTVVVITDRNDLDDQLFGTFSKCHELLRQSPKQAENREDLRKKLQVASGGVIFTTIQKFMPDQKGEDYPQLSDRSNIIVIADEAHRSQYDFIDGFARHMRDALPNASFIGFTGTPLELTDRNTKAVFGDYISIYDIQRAVHDGATVPIYYEGRWAKLDIDRSHLDMIDEDFEEATEGEEIEKKEKLKSKWAQIEAIVGTENRIKKIAEDFVSHFEDRLEAMEGKAMFVCMSRRICVDMYNAITKIKPQWHGEDDGKGEIKVVMSGAASDPEDWQMHIRSKRRREALATRFKDPDEDFKIVIVRDMWLTGFDAPSLHSMYVDKPMKGHGLMQAIARVNRVFKNKPGGLIVDYLGLAHQLKIALSNYTESGGKGNTAIDQDQAVAVMIREYEKCCNLFHGFDYTKWITGTPEQKLGLIPAAQEHILEQDDGKSRLNRIVGDLSKAFALSVPHEKTHEIRNDVGFFQAVKAALNKSTSKTGRSPEEINQAIKQIISSAIATDKVVDIFDAAGLKKPDISILSNEFLAEVKGMKHKNLAVELLRKLLLEEMKEVKRTNLVQSRSFSAMLKKTINLYQNQSVKTAQIIEELIKLAKQMREAKKRGEKLGLSAEEVAFYDALETNDSAVKVLGDDTLKIIARELVETVHRNATIDWSVKESIRAKMRIMVKRILRKYGYPPDMQEKATKTVLEQAELLCGET